MHSRQAVSAHVSARELIMTIHQNSSLSRGPQFAALRPAHGRGPAPHRLFAPRHHKQPSQRAAAWARSVRFATHHPHHLQRFTTERTGTYIGELASRTYLWRTPPPLSHAASARSSIADRRSRGAHSPYRIACLLYQKKELFASSFAGAACAAASALPLEAPVA